MLIDLDGDAESPLAAAAEQLLEEARAMVRDVIALADQGGGAGGASAAAAGCHHPPAAAAAGDGGGGGRPVEPDRPALLHPAAGGA